MPSPMLKRIRAEETAARRRSLWRVIGVLLVIVGAFEVASSLIFGTFSEIYQHLAGRGALMHFIIGLVLIGAGWWAHYHNREEL